MHVARVSEKGYGPTEVDYCDICQQTWPDAELTEAGELDVCPDCLPDLMAEADDRQFSDPALDGLNVDQ